MQLAAEAVIHGLACALKGVLALVAELASGVVGLEQFCVQPQKDDNFHLHDVDLRHDVRRLPGVGLPLVSAHQCDAGHQSFADLQPDELQKSFVEKLPQEALKACDDAYLTYEPVLGLMLASSPSYPLPTLYAS